MSDEVVFHSYEQFERLMLPRRYAERRARMNLWIPAPREEGKQ